MIELDEVAALEVGGVPAGLVLMITAQVRGAALVCHKDTVDIACADLQPHRAACSAGGLRPHTGQAGVENCQSERH